jgi:cation diffusion facilitator family transporter
MPLLAVPLTVAASYRQVARAAGLGLAINFLLAVTKLIGGVVGHSFALIADAVNSLGDVVASVVVLVALRVAQLPPDDEHPYGHTRAEGIAAANVALLIIVSAALVAWEAIGRFGTPHPAPPLWTLWIAGANVAIKEALYQYKVRIGRRVGSMALVANAWDHRSDAFCSLAVLVGLAAVRWGGADWLWADEVASLFVAAAIVWSGVALFRKSSSELMDVQADPDFVERIRAAALAVPDVQNVEKLWVRKSGLEYFADIHIQVDGGMTVAAGHGVGHVVKDVLLSQFATLRDVLIHLEPAEDGTPRSDGPSSSSGSSASSAEVAWESRRPSLPTDRA